jgi:hypothetical protein
MKILTDKSGREYDVNAFFRIDGIDKDKRNYQVTLLNSKPYGTNTEPLTRVKISYLDSRAVLVTEKDFNEYMTQNPKK